MVMGWERCRKVPHGRQDGQDLCIMQSMWSSWMIGVAMPWCFLPFALRDHSRGHGKGGCGCSCGRLEWEAVRGQRVQIHEELVWVSSTALFITLSCRRAREGALMLLFGAVAGMCNPGALRPPGGGCGSFSSGFRLSIKTMGWNWGSVRS